MEKMQHDDAYMPALGDQRKWASDTCPSRDPGGHVMGAPGRKECTLTAGPLDQLALACSSTIHKYVVGSGRCAFDSQRQARIREWLQALWQRALGGSARRFSTLLR